MWLLHPPKSRSRWHVFTWLAAVPALGFVALVQVVGVGREEHNATQGSTFAATVTYLHGWPRPWLERSLDYQLKGATLFSGLLGQVKNEASGQLFDYPTKYRGEDVAWTSWQAWPTFANRRRVEPMGLVVNLVVALAIVGSSMLVTEWWLRRRGGLRFRVLDFLKFVALFAGIVGLWKWDQGVVRREHAIASRAEFDTSPFSPAAKVVITGYVGPEWLARLCGNERLVPLFHRFTAFSVVSDLVDEVDYRSFRELRHLTTAQVNLEGWMVPEYGLECLARLPQVDTLVISSRLDYPSRRHEPLPPTNFSVLSNVETIVFAYRVPYEDLLELQGMPRLRSLMVDPNWYTPEQLATLEAAFPGVTIGANDNPPPFIY